MRRERKRQRTSRVREGRLKRDARARCMTHACAVDCRAGHVTAFVPGAAGGGGAGPGAAWRHQWLASRLAVSSKLRLRVDVCIVGGARLDLPSRLRERPPFFPLPPLSRWARVSLSLSPLSLIYLSLSITPYLCGVCCACRRLGPENVSPLRVWLPGGAWCCFRPACVPREVLLREETIATQ